MTLDHLIDIHIKGTTIDELRNEVASRSFRSPLADNLRNGGIRSPGTKSSPDDIMISIVERMPKRYVGNVIDHINEGFQELHSARPVRYQVVISNHICRGSRAAQAQEMDLTINQFKNELMLGREYLVVRFIHFIHQR